MHSVHCCPKFFPSLTNLQCVPGVWGHGWGDSLQVVLACWLPLSHKLVLSHLAYSDTGMWLKSIRHLKHAIFTHNFAMSATPGSLSYTVMVIATAPNFRNYSTGYLLNC